MRVRKCGGGALVSPWERVGRAHRIPGAARTLFLAAALHALGLAGSLNFRFPVSVFRSHSPSLVWKATFLQFPLDFTNIFPSVQGTSAALSFLVRKTHTDVLAAPWLSVLCRGHLWGKWRGGDSGSPHMGPTWNS